MTIVLISHVLGGMKAQVVSIIFGTHGMLWITLMDKVIVFAT
jgi:hypothetical protein